MMTKTSNKEFLSYGILAQVWASYWCEEHGFFTCSYPVCKTPVTDGWKVKSEK